MENMKFKTNINCSGCVAKVTPFLNEALGENNWKVNTNEPTKELIVKGVDDEKKVVEAVNNAGFRAARL